jgi:uncharacterized membrane protein YphA (DoxX/SURF4 family)
MLSAVFISGGLDALRSPHPRAELASGVATMIARPLHLPEDPVTLVRINAGVQVGAGLLLATGKFRRLAAVALLGSLVPTTVGGHAFWDQPTPEAKAQQRTHFLKNLGLAGGLILAAVDTEGKPSLGWRARRAAKVARRSAEGARELFGDRVDEFSDRVEDLAQAFTQRLPG